MDCICGRRPSKDEGTVLKMWEGIESDDSVVHCSQKECGKVVHDIRGRKMAKLAGTLYPFCSEKCYYFWLSRPVLRMIS